ncbi:F-box only protein 25 isoform X3 [Pteronotus mesoamericanus]|uniref:F-box only protein 25 isoform X3 n=1 Tax=Pteronotus mesoamericanus TaxID=1884717 RepID=UPI0023EC2F65|nr:F-box only protein 25 isoform X3 [Pteronotus parnellii mesoamericanus]
MPFLGQDWRSPGWSWTKTDDGWKRCEPCSEEPGRGALRPDGGPRVILNSEHEETFTDEEHGYASKKRKKDHFRNDSNTQCFYREKWIYVHKESTRERHGYCTLGEAFTRLDFSSAVQDVRRFSYVVRLLQLIAKSQLTSLSGVAQKNYFNVLDKIVQKVLEDHQNPRLIKDLLQDLSSTLGALLRGVGKSVLVGNIDVWACRLDTILAWQQQLQNLQVTQFCRHLILSEKGHVEWKRTYFALQKCYPAREQYGDTLHFCRRCSTLFWKDCHLALLFKDSGHPCTAADPDSCLTPVSPQHFIDLFKF